MAILTKFSLPLFCRIHDTAVAHLHPLISVTLNFYYSSFKCSFSKEMTFELLALIIAHLMGGQI